MNTRKIVFDQKGDERGSLIVIEGNQTIPFDIKRVFYMVDTLNDVARGNHANRQSSFVLVNIKGSVKIKVDDGINQDVHTLDQVDTGVYIPKMVWKEMYDFSKDAVLLVLSDQHYQENEYIRNYDDFKREIGGMK